MSAKLNPQQIIKIQMSQIISANKRKGLQQRERLQTKAEQQKIDLIFQNLYKSIRPQRQKEVVEQKINTTQFNQQVFIRSQKPADPLVVTNQSNSRIEQNKREIQLIQKQLQFQKEAVAIAQQNTNKIMRQLIESDHLVKRAQSESRKVRQLKLSRLEDQLFYRSRVVQSQNQDDIESIRNRLKMQ